MANGYRAMLAFANGVVASVETNRIAPRRHPTINAITINLLGSHGMLALDLTNRGVVRRFTAERMDYPDVFVLPKVHGCAIGFAHASIRGFCDRTLSGAPFTAGLDDGVAVTRTPCAILASTRLGQPVDVVL